MASDAAEPAKLLLPYLQRADELQKHEPLVAYYCRLYAMEKGLIIPQKERTKMTNSILISLMNSLEKDKKNLNLSADDNLHLEGFASNVFARADKQDRAGRADLTTAKTFYAASIFYEILNQFGDLHPELEQKQKYAAWKAAEIRKAIKEGRKPEAGPPGGEKDMTMPSLSPSNSLDLGRSQSFSTRQQGTIDTPPPSASFDNPSPAKDLDRRQSFYQDTPLPPPPPPPFDNPSPAKDLDRRQSFSSGYNTAPTHYTPPPYTAPSNSNSNSNSNYSSPIDPQYPQNYPTNPNEQQPYFPPDPSNYPNFQSYPSFQDTTLPSGPPHQPSFSYPDSSSQFQNVFSNQHVPVAPPVAPPIAPRVSEPVPVAENYRYDSSYQPSVEKISEAHKAARFAVGALAFDDVVVAVDHLKRALDLLTNPDAKTH